MNAKQKAKWRWFAKREPSETSWDVVAVKRWWIPEKVFALFAHDGIWPDLALVQPFRSILTKRVKKWCPEHSPLDRTKICKYGYMIPHTIPYEEED